MDPVQFKASQANTSVRDVFNGRYEACLGFGGTGPQGGSSSSYIGFSCENFRLKVIRVYLGIVTCYLSTFVLGGR